VFGANEEILVSDRFRQFWAESLLTGLSGFHPVKVKRVKRHRRKEAKQTEVPPYFFVDIARTRTAIDLRASGFVFDSNEDVCPECLTGGIIKKFDRIVIEPSTWTGEDIFIARGLPGTILVSERFKAFRDENDISNAYLVPVEEFGIKF